ncbi:MAG: clostripain-related cysteine peptidase [Candidatus Omnitrophota bacterium]
MNVLFLIAAILLAAMPGWTSVRPFSKSGFTNDPGTLAPYTPPAPHNGTGKKLLAIYMVGSDLESNDLAGTTDLNELITGYNEIAPGAVDVIVAFGGANKDGWRGMKFADMDQVIKDSQNGAYGDETANSSYLYAESQAHMGDESSLILFLQYIQEGYQNYDQRFLVLWDHGGSYSGFGNDENFNFDALSLREIKNAFVNGQAGVWDIIGFDACLMASMEVALIVKDYAKYLIASEELEPGHGWNWKGVVKEYAKRSAAVEAAKAIVNDYVQDIHPYYASGKTLSVVDLSRMDEASSKIDAVAWAFANALDNNTEDKPAVLEASTKSQVYGQQGKNDQRISLDLLHFAQIAQSKIVSGENSQKLAELIAVLQSLVVLARDDGTKPNSNGISITAPENSPGISAYYGTPGMEAFQTAFQKIKQDDVESPDIVDQNPDADAGDIDFSDPLLSLFEGEVDPAFYEWLWKLEEEIWIEYEAGNLTDDELNEELELLYSSYTEESPEYQEWLAEVVYDPEQLMTFVFIPESILSYFISGDFELPPAIDGSEESDGDIASFNPSPSYPFLIGDRAAFVYQNGGHGPGTQPLSDTPVQIQGLLVDFSDPNLTNVVTTFGLLSTFDVDDDGNIDDWFMTVAEVEAYSTSKPGQFFTPKWNQYWYFMDYDPEADPMYLPLYFTNKTKILGRYFTLYASEIDYQDADVDYSTGTHEVDFYGNPVDYASLNFIVADNNIVVDHDIRPYKILYSGPDDEYGTVQYDKNAKKIKIGDAIRFYSLGINLTREGYDFWFEESDLLTIAQEPTYFVELLQFEDENGELLDYYYAMRAEDVAGNAVMTDPALAAAPPDDTSVSNWSIY